MRTEFIFNGEVTASFIADTEEDRRLLALAFGGHELKRWLFTDDGSVTLKLITEEKTCKPSDSRTVA